MPRPDWRVTLQRQVIRLRLRVAFVLSLPFIVGTLWYAAAAFMEIDRYRRAVGSEVVIDAELFQIALHDTLERDLRRLFLPVRPENSALPTFEVSLRPGGLEQMMAAPKKSGKRPYVKAFIRKDGQVHAGKVRLRGSRHWHWLAPQKSLKVRVQTGDLIDGVRVFNLINDVTPFGLEEEVILGIARDEGLLTPEYHPAWLRLNNVDMGVYRYEAQPAEGLLRRAKRMPGSVYSGNADPVGKAPAPAGVGPLFGGLTEWRKAAWRDDDTKTDFAELARLLRAVEKSDHLGFRAFARDELDLDKLALADALDVVFGGDQHDYLSNHKLYYDAYRGRFEPIAWNYRAFTFDPAFNLAENPLLLRLKAIPDYLWQRDQIVHELLIGPASVPAVRSRVDAIFKRLRPDLEADPHWDAYKLMARASRFHRFMVRPMSTGRWLLASRGELATYGRRVRFLIEALEGDQLVVAGGRVADDLYVVAARTGGHDAQRWQRLTVTGSCAGRFTLYADSDRNGELEVGRDPEVAAGPMGESVNLRDLNHLLPGVRLRPRPEAQPKHGSVVSERVTRHYRYFLVTSECPAAVASLPVTLELDSLVTGASSRRHLDLATGQLPAWELPALPAAASVPQLSAGDSSPHPWAFGATPLPETVTLGPGPVAVTESRVFSSHQSVVVAAGSRLVLGPAVSLVFEGPVSIRGTVAAPVEIVAADPGNTFGGLLLRGPATAGSSFAHLRITGGSHPTHLALHAPSLINIYDTRDISLRDVSVRGVETSDDLVHATYVENLELFELELHGGPMDGIDLEMSTASIRGARIIGPGDECIDLMGSEVRIVDSLLIGCTNSAISAGEETEATVNGVAIAGAKVGILSKNGSAVRVSRSLIYRTEQALRTNRRDVHYGGISTIDAQELFAVACDQVVREAKRTRVKTAALREGLPVAGEVDHLRRQVLGLESWSELDRAIAGIGEQGP